MENQELNTVTTEQTEEKQVEMISIKFSRKLARPFTSKGGKEMVAISIPNEDPADTRAWEEFVLPVQLVHSDHFGSKTLWAKIPEDGMTTLTKSVRSEETDSWEKKERVVGNKTLKALVEAYKLKPKAQGAR